jgi:hypothetical protein
VQPFLDSLAAVKNGSADYSTRRSDSQLVPACQRSQRGTQLASEFFGLQVLSCDARWIRVIVSSVLNCLRAVHGRRLPFAPTPHKVHIRAKGNRGHFSTRKTNIYAAPRADAKFVRSTVGGRALGAKATVFHLVLTCC